jgi:hypothetical protein
VKTFSINDIRSWQPCYDPNKYLPETWQGTVLDLLCNDDIPLPDRLWVIMRNDLVSDKLMRLFAVWCARQVQHLMKDERSLRALDVAEAFANGNATQEELAAACDAAWAAARSAASDAAWDAAWAVAWAAARSAAWAAASDAARDAASGAASGAARAAAWDAQKQKLREMILAGVETGDVL